ncbi:MAG: orotidine-5'-phosphate decarboxylase [Candidatus Brocadiia bacterium]|jgi:orotidine-5'-phosphate decarboxylase
MKNFADRLIETVECKRTCVVVGLDPQLDSLPSDLREKARRSTADAADAVMEFNRRVLAAVADHAAAVKPQSAFYEALGWEGVRALAGTVRAAHDCGLLVIADVKRGDIGSTAEAYAQGHLDLLQADAVTVNPYLGIDGVAPFLKRARDGKGIFVLVKTSNPSSVDLQDLDASGAKLYEKVAELVERWGGECRGECGYSAVGAVVGATFPAAAEKLRRLMPHALFLVPGYGAQGATAEDCRPCFDAQGRGAVVNSSRGIIFAYRRPDQPQAPPDWDSAVAGAAIKMKEELERVRRRA